MFNIKSNALKKTKKNYINILKNRDLSSYLLHEKIINSLNRSSASAYLDTTTASKTNLTRSSYCKLPVNENENNTYKIKKCSYTDFLALRNNKITAPFNYTNERFKWQNLKDEHALVDPSMNLKPHKKQFLLKDTFGEGLLNYIDKEEYKPKIRRYRRYNTEIDNHIQNIDIDISRRVINPEYNKEISSLFKKGKRSLSQAINFYHRTNGNLSSLFNLTPINIENKTKKKLFKNKSFAAPTINIFSDNF